MGLAQVDKWPARILAQAGTSNLTLTKCGKKSKCSPSLYHACMLSLAETFNSPVHVIDIINVMNIYQIQLFWD